MAGNARDRLVLDTNLVIEFLAGNDVVVSAFKRRDIYLSVINELEVLGFKHLTTDEDVEIRGFLKTCTICNIDEAIKERTTLIQRNFGLKLADAIVAATASVLDIPLITADKDFTRLPISLVHIVRFQP